MIKILIPVFLLAIIAVTVLVIHKRESKGAKARRLETERDRLVALVESLDDSARAEYAVNDNNTFAWNVTDKVIAYKRNEK